MHALLHVYSVGLPPSLPPPKVPRGANHFVPRPEAFACSTYGTKGGTWNKPGDPCEEVEDLTLYDYPR